MLPELELYHSPRLQSNHGIINAQNIPHSSDPGEGQPGSMLCQLSGVIGVVTYMSHVEAFVAGIKIESSDQSPFCMGANQGIKVASELLKINNNQERAAAFDL